MSKNTKCENGTCGTVYAYVYYIRYIHVLYTYTVRYMFLLTHISTFHGLILPTSDRSGRITPFRVGRLIGVHDSPFISHILRLAADWKMTCFNTFRCHDCHFSGGSDVGQKDLDWIMAKAGMRFKILLENKVVVRVKTHIFFDIEPPLSGSKHGKGWIYGNFF